MGLKESGQIGGIEVHPTNPNIVWLAALGSPFGPNDERGIFKTTDARQDVEEDAVRRTTRPAGATSRSTGRIPTCSTRRCIAASARAGTSSAAGRPSKGGIYKSTDGGETWKHITAGLPQGSDRQDRHRHRAQQPARALRDGRGPRRAGRAVPIERRRRDRGRSSTTASGCARGRSTSTTSRSTRRTKTKCGSTSSASRSPPTAARPSPRSTRRTATTTACGSTPTTRTSSCRSTTAAPTSRLNGGKSWSSILNQPTAEYYMVAVDEQYPYRLYMPQQDNSTLIIPSIPPVSWGFDIPSEVWQQASGCETGQIWPRKDGKVVWGACKGEVGRYNVGDRARKSTTGCIRRTATATIPTTSSSASRARPSSTSRRTTTRVDLPGVARAASIDRRGRDVGHRSAPTSRRKEPQYQIVPGNPITRDVTGEEVYSSIYAMIESRLEKGVIWVGANDGPVSVTRDNGKTWKNVTPKGLGPAARVQTIEDSPHRARPRLRRRSIAIMREHDLKPYIYQAPTTTARRGRCSPTARTASRSIIRRTSCARIRSARACSTPAPSSASSSRSTPAATGSRCSRTCRRRRSPTSRCTATISSSRRWGGRCGSWTTSRRCSSWRRLPSGAPTAGGGHDGGAAEQAAATAWRRCRRSTIFQPREVIRLRNSTAPASADEPEYPMSGAQFDLYFAAAPGADTKLEVLDARGGALRTWSVLPPRSAGAGAGDARRRRRFPRRRRQLARHSRRSGHAADHVGPALPGTVDGGRA